MRLSFILPLFAGAISLLAGSAGRVGGTVLDPASATVGGARLTATNESTGQQRRTTTNGEGRYVFPSLETGTYSLELEANGFAAQVKRGLAVTVDGDDTVDFRLTLARVAERVEVTADPALLLTGPASGGLVDNRRMLTLPINGRDFTRFALLTPGAVPRSGRIGDLSFNGLHSTHNAYSIDGVDASRVDQTVVSNGFDRGARLLTGSMEGLAEFRVQTHNYRAEHGRAAGGVITVASRSGGNDTHGGLLYFFRNDLLDARNFFNIDSQAKAPFRYNNFGASLGGALKKNRTFYFGSYEGSRQRLGVTASGTVPSEALRAQVLATSPALRPLVELFPAGTGATANPLISSFVTSRSLAVGEDAGSLRLDHVVNENHRLFGRVSINDSAVTGPLFSSTATALGVNDNQYVPSRTTNFAVGYQAVLTPRLLLDITGGMQAVDTSSDTTQPVPTVNITGITASVGGRRKSQIDSRLFQVNGALSYQAGQHLWKFGATVIPAHTSSLTSNSLTITYLSPAAFVANQLGQAAITPSQPYTTLGAVYSAYYAQDTWRVGKTLTVDVGLRYDYANVTSDTKGQLRPYLPQTGALGAPGAAFYQAPGKNFAPRFGVAWQPHSRVMIRSGYGIFYMQNSVGYGQNIIANSIPGNTVLVLQQFPTLRWPLDPALTGSAAPGAVYGFNPDRRDTYSQQWNFSVGIGLGANASLQAAYLGNRGLNIRRAANINFINPATGRRPLPQFSSVNIEGNDSQSTYNGLQLSLQTRARAGVQFALNYTWAKALDDVNDSNNLLPAFLQDPFCRACERGYAAADSRHVMSYTALYALPFGKGPGHWTKALVRDWTLASLASARTGVPVNVTIPLNTFGSDNFTGQRPDRVTGVDPYTSNPSAGGWLNAAAFAVPQRGRYGNSARNAVYGPGMLQVDASAVRLIRLSERTNLQFRTEVFNLLNTPIFAQPGAVLGTADFGRILNTLGRAIGAGTSRQVQFALRLSF
jgi:outer membrane receptor protein involved in Fe transport